MTMVLFTGVAIVRERDRGNMELLIATPVSSTELMVGKMLPLMHFLRLIRRIMLRGTGLSEMLPDVLALLAFVLVMMATAVLIFRKRLD